MSHTDLQLLHAWLEANWSASYQLRFLASLSLIYSIVRLFQCPRLVQQCLTLRHLNKVIVISSLGRRAQNSGKRQLARVTRMLYKIVQVFSESLDACHSLLEQGGLEALPMIQRVKVRASFHRCKQNLVRIQGHSKVFTWLLL